MTFVDIIHPFYFFASSIEILLTRLFGSLSRSKHLAEGGQGANFQYVPLVVILGFAALALIIACLIPSSRRWVCSVMRGSMRESSEKEDTCKQVGDLAMVQLNCC